MKIAVIGAGSWGQNLIRVFSELGVLTHICDSQPDRLRMVGAKYPQAKLVESPRAVIEDSSINGVVVATPAETHFEIAQKLLEAGKDVFVEKPLVLHCEEAEYLMDLARERNRILMVGHLLEFHPAVTRLQEIIETGELGRIEYIYSNRLNLGKVRREENALWSFAPHDISVILLLLKKLPIQITATGGAYLQPNVADVTISTMLFDRGVRAHIFVSWLHPYKEQKLIVVGERRIAEFDDVSKDNKLLLYDKKIDLVGGQFVVEKPTPRPVVVPPGEPLMIECKHFIDCVNTRQQPKTDGADAWRVLKVLEASQRSLSMNGEPVQLEPHRLLQLVHA
jgi:UDP-2-acetamido-3-amino-2,3-dideoxy-glucuronate N-acetyltransferase